MAIKRYDIRPKGNGTLYKIDENGAWVKWEDVARLLLSNTKLSKALRSLSLSVMAHPDYTGEDNAEWTDLIDSADDALNT